MTEASVSKRALYRVTVSKDSKLSEVMGRPDVTTEAIVADNMRQAVEYALTIVSARGRFVRSVEFVSCVVALPVDGGAQ